MKIQNNAPGISLNSNNKMKAPTQQDIANTYEKIAEGMESQFVQHLWEEMRKTVDVQDEPNAATDFYNSMMDRERSDMMAKKGLGLKQMILKELYPQHPSLQKDNIVAKSNDAIKKHSDNSSPKIGGRITIKEGQYGQ